jgi:8-oxo-dGTP pyrophosphatase MutT (NUDIX family)
MKCSLEELIMIDKIAWIYIKEDKILCTLSKGKKKYYIPGGKRNEFENDIETLTREVNEELSVDLNLDTIKYYGTFKAQADGKEDGVVVKMSCYMAEYQGNLKVDNEIAEILWLSYKDIDKISAVDKLIFKDLYGKGFIK